jgi:hypothetical protein
MDYPPKFGSVLSELWNTAKLSGIASLIDGQPLFRPRRERDFRVAISVLLLDLYIGEFESCWIWIGGVPKLG